jgi:hypothetical protein
MRGSTWIFVLGFAVACGEKAPPEASAEPTQAAATPAPEPTEPAVEAPPVEEAPVEAAPAPAPEPAIPASNADLQITVSFNDGSSKAGHVWLVERSTDWYAEEDWTSAAGQVKLQLEGNGTEIMAPWSEIKKIQVVIAKVSESSDCTYNSDFRPWMYDCTLRNKGTATTVDGRSWDITDRHKWRVSFDGGDSAEFWLYKHPARQQDEETVGLDSTGENYDLYIGLQDRLREEVKTMVTGVTVSAP